MLIYKTHMHPEASLDPEHCTPKSGAKARRSWLHAHIKIVDQYEDVYSPAPNEGDTHMEEDTTHAVDAAVGEHGLQHGGAERQSGNAKRKSSVGSQRSTLT